MRGDSFQDYESYKLNQSSSAELETVQSTYESRTTKS